MKKRYIYITILVVVFALSSIFLWMHFDNDVDKVNNSRIESENNYVEPPRMLVFSKMEELEELFSNKVLPEHELSEYLESKNYYMNGLTSRTDVEDLEAELSGITFPCIPDFVLSQLIIYPERKQVFWLYEKMDGTVVTYLVSYDEAMGQDISIDTEKDIPIERMNVESMQSLYFLDDPDEVSDIFTYKACVNDQLAIIRVFHADKETADTYISEIAFSSFQENMTKAQN